MKRMLTFILLLYIGNYLTVCLATPKPSPIEIESIQKEVKEQVKLSIQFKHQHEFEQAFACLNNALSIANTKNDAAGRIFVWINMSDLKRWQKQYDQSFIYINKVLTDPVLKNYPILKSEILNQEGVLHRDKGDLEKAIKYFQEALEVARQIPNDRLIARSARNIGNVLKSQKKRKESLFYLNIALTAFTQISDYEGLAETYKSMAHININLGYYHKALSLSFSCLDHYRRIQDKKNESFLLGYLSTIYRKMGYYDSALEYALASLRIGEEIENERNIASACTQIGLVYQHLKRYDEALTYFKRTLTLGKSSSSLKYIASAHKNLASIYDNMGHYEMSLKHSQMSLEIFNKIHDANGIVSALINIGNSLAKLQKWNQAIDHYNKAKVSAKKFNDRWNQSTIELKLGELYEERHQPKAAITHYKQALSIAEAIEARALMATGYESMFHLYRKINHDTEASIYAQKYILTQKEINNQKIQSRISDLQALSKIERKDREIDALKMQSRIHELELSKAHQEKEILEREKELKISALDKRKKVSWLLACIIVLILILMLTFFFRNQTLKRLQRILSKQKRQIELRNQELKNINIAKDKFFSLIAHDLKGAFGHLDLGLELLYCDREELQPEDFNDLLRQTYQTSQNTYRLLEDLLEWAHLQMNNLEPSYTHFNLIEHVENILEHIESAADKKEIHITLNIPQTLDIYADQRMIETVLRNFISNAIKFTPRNGHIHISAERLKTQAIRVSVTDNGTGMNPKIQEDIFRIDRITSSPGTEGEQGTGLGLIISKEMIAKHNGSIDIKSELGKGCDISFIIPQKNSQK